MRTHGRIAVLMATVLLSGSLAHAEPRPRRWYKDWKWWVGEALIAGIRAADAHSTVTTHSRCPGCIETNFFLGKRPSTGAVVAISGAGFSLESALHILSWKYCPDERSRWWRAASYALVPGVDAAGSIPGIVHNYGLYSQPNAAPSSPMILRRSQLTISPGVSGTALAPGHFDLPSFRYHSCPGCFGPRVPHTRMAFTPPA
jgi:hypothetical protein